jgi:3-oxoacyl-[acyl-carrier protein] reductase
MSFDLTGSRALVTGAGHGIGRGIAVALAEAGADVVVHYGSSAEAAAETVGEVEARGRKAVAIGADLTRTDETERLIAESVDFLGGLDILVCNAGHLVGRSPIEQMSDEHYVKTIEVNLGSTFRTCRTAIPHLRASGHGRIVTMASLAAHNGGGNGSTAYAASKAGVIGFSKGLAKELAGDGITVNAVAPGFIGQTKFHDTFTTPEGRATAVAGIPVRREGLPVDVAAAVVYLVSPEAGFITGTTIDIDGGVRTR